MVDKHGICALLLSLAVGCAQAAEVVVAVPLSMQPYFIPIQDRGLAYDTIKAAFASQGYSVKPLYVSGRHISRLIGKDPVVDCVPFITTEQAKDWFPSRALRYLHDYAITRPGLVISGVDDLRSKRVVAYQSAKNHLGEAFHQMAEDNPQYRELHNHRAQIQLLLQGSVDVIIADRLLVAWYLEHLRTDGWKRTKVSFHDLFEPMWHDFVCRSQAFASAFRDGVSAIEASGELSEIRHRYGIEDSDYPLRPLVKSDLGTGDPASTRQPNGAD